MKNVSLIILLNKATRLKGSGCVYKPITAASAVTWATTSATTRRT